jgi:hypothetical protein
MKLVDGRQQGIDAVEGELETFSTEDARTTGFLDDVFATRGLTYQFRAGVGPRNAFTNNSGATGIQFSGLGEYVSTGTTAGTIARTGTRVAFIGGEVDCGTDELKAAATLDISDFTEEGRLTLFQRSGNGGYSRLQFISGDIELETQDTGGGTSSETVVSGPSTGSHDFYLHHKPGEWNRVWVDKDPDDNDPDLEKTTNLPGGVATNRLWNLYATNPDGIDLLIRMEALIIGVVG